MMARSKPRSDEPTQPTPPDELSEDAPTTPPPESGASEQVPEEEPKSEPKPKLGVSAEREITAQVFVRGKGDLGNAFLASLSVEYGKRFPKKTKGGWAALYEKFMKAPR